MEQATEQQHLKGAVRKKLTARELDLIKLFCSECLSTKQVAALLNLSRKTVETHRANIHRKTGTHNMAELCREYWRRFYSEQQDDEVTDAFDAIFCWVPEAKDGNGKEMTLADKIKALGAMYDHFVEVDSHEM